MVIHFDNQAAAEKHLSENNFRPIKSGRYVKNGVNASIHPIAGRPEVAIFFVAKD